MIAHQPFCNGIHLQWVSYWPNQAQRGVSSVQDGRLPVQQYRQSLDKIRKSSTDNNNRLRHILPDPNNRASVDSLL